MGSGLVLDVFCVATLFTPVASTRYLSLNPKKPRNGTHYADQATAPFHSLQEIILT